MSVTKLILLDQEPAERRYVKNIETHRILTDLYYTSPHFDGSLLKRLLYNADTYYNCSVLDWFINSASGCRLGNNIPLKISAKLKCDKILRSVISTYVLDDFLDTGYSLDTAEQADLGMEIKCVTFFFCFVKYLHLKYNYFL